MKTKIFNKDISDAADILRNGGLVAVPTETVYGLAGNGLDEEAVKQIYEVKGRPAVKPLSLMVYDKYCIEKYCENVPVQAYTLADRFWPGPLTIVLKSCSIVPSIVRAGGETVGLRCPDHPLTLEALKKADIPFAAPSANPSGEESPKDAQKVREYFDGKIEGIIDGGTCGIGMESTIIDMSVTPYKILRQGALEKRMIEQALADKLAIVGITGGTGCGKTTALNVLKSMGAVIIDCDSVYHTLLADCAEMNAELFSAFPEAFADGMLDRKALGKIVFNDPEKLAKLNEITHRYVKLELERILCEVAMEGKTLAAIDAIELISSGLTGKCSFTVGVSADRESRISRIMKRDGISEEYAAMRIDAQHPEKYFADNCDFILANNGSEAEFVNKCKTFFKEKLK